MAYAEFYLVWMYSYFLAVGSFTCRSFYSANLACGSYCRCRYRGNRQRDVFFDTSAAQTCPSCASRQQHLDTSNAPPIKGKAGFHQVRNNNLFQCMRSKCSNAAVNNPHHKTPSSAIILCVPSQSTPLLTNSHPHLPSSPAQSYTLRRSLSRPPSHLAK